MDAMELIRAVDAIRPNSVDTDRKVRWLSRCDALIAEHLRQGRIDAMGLRPFRGECEADAVCGRMMIGEPHAALYEYYLMAQIDLVNADMARYNNDTILFNSALQELCRRFHTQSAPKRRVRIRV